MATSKQTFISDLTVAELWAIFKMAVGTMSAILLFIGLPAIFFNWTGNASAEYFGLSSSKWATPIVYLAIGAVPVIWPNFVAKFLSDWAKVITELSAWWKATRFIARTTWTAGIATSIIISVISPRVAIGVFCSGFIFIDAIYTVRGRRKLTPDGDAAPEARGVAAKSQDEDSITLRSGRSVKLESFHTEYTYAGLIVGYPKSEQGYITDQEKRATTIWGPRKIHTIQPSPIVREHDGRKYESWPWRCCQAWLTSESIDPSDMGSQLVVIWFDEGEMNLSIPKLIEQGCRDVPWEQNAEGFTF